MIRSDVVSIGKPLATALGLACVLASSAARAALTDSEKAQIRELYAKGEASSAPRVRAMLARTDHAPAEVAAAFADAARRVPFDEAHMIYVRDMLFGPATAASRSDLLPAVVGGLLARGVEVAGGQADERARGEELVRIHGFVAREIAGAGTPPKTGHDPNAGIRDDAYRALVEQYRAHLALPVLDRARVPAGLRAARAQAEIALIDLAAGLSPTSEVAAWIGADAAERQAFEKTGVLVIGLSGAPAGKAASVMRLLDAASNGLGNASALWIGKPRPRGIAARGGLLVAQAPLESAKRVTADSLWSRAVEPSSPDASLAEVAFVLARTVANNAMDDAAFAEAAQRSADRAGAAGDAALLAIATAKSSLELTTPESHPTYAAADVLTRSIELLLLDAPRAVSVALAASLAGRQEPAEQLVLALAALVRSDDKDNKGKVLGETATLGRLTDSGTITPAAFTSIKGRGLEVESFALEGHTISFSRAADGSIAKLEEDKKPLTLGMIPFARVPTTAAEHWLGPKRGKDPVIELERLVGKPEVGFADAGRFIVRGVQASKVRDAVAVKGTGDEIAADVRVGEVSAAVLVRAASSGQGLSGISVTLEPGDSARAFLFALDGTGARAPLAEPVSIAKQAAEGRHVKIAIVKGVITATVDGQTLTAKVPEFLASAGGSAAFMPGNGSEIEVRNLKLPKKKAR